MNAEEQAIINIVSNVLKIMNSSTFYRNLERAIIAALPLDVRKGSAFPGGEFSKAEATPLHLIVPDEA